MILGILAALAMVYAYRQTDSLIFWAMGWIIGGYTVVGGIIDMLFKQLGII